MHPREGDQRRRFESRLQEAVGAGRACVVAGERRPRHLGRRREAPRGRDRLVPGSNDRRTRWNSRAPRERRSFGCAERRQGQRGGTARMKRDARSIANGIARVGEASSGAKGGARRDAQESRRRTGRRAACGHGSRKVPAWAVHDASADRSSSAACGEAPAGEWYRRQAAMGGRSSDPANRSAPGIGILPAKRGSSRTAPRAMLDARQEKQLCGHGELTPHQSQPQGASAPKKRKGGVRLARAAEVKAPERSRSPEGCTMARSPGQAPGKPRSAPQRRGGMGHEGWSHGQVKAEGARDASAAAAKKIGAGA